MGIFTFEVDVCVSRPPSPANNRTLTVTLLADSELDAWSTACEMALVRKNVVMVTATRLVDYRE